LAVPIFTPVTVGCEAGAVWPALIEILAGDIVSLDVSVLPNITVTPPAGAACGSDTAKGVDWPNATVAFDGRVTAPKLTTVTPAVVSARFVALAWIVALPIPTALTAIVTLVWDAGNVAVEGTVATLVLLELTLTVKPPGGAGPERLSVRVALPLTPIVTFCCVKLRVAATCTACLSPKKPPADALIFADPRPTPVIVGCVAGVVSPAAIKTVAVEIVTFVVSSLISAMVAPPTGAPVTIVTGKVTGVSSPIVRLEGKVICPSMAAPTVTVPLV
jgi:hypothetical protein